MSAPRRALSEQALHLIRKAGERSREIDQHAREADSAVAGPVAALSVSLLPSAAVPLSTTSPALDPTRCTKCRTKLILGSESNPDGTTAALCPTCERTAPKVCACGVLFAGPRDQCSRCSGWSCPECGRGKTPEQVTCGRRPCKVRASSKTRGKGAVKRNPEPAISHFLSHTLKGG